MANIGKWIGGGLGWAFLGPMGALLGFVVGSLLDESIDSPTIKSEKKIERNTTSGDFNFSLLVLIAAVMKADGKVRLSELSYVKNYFIRAYGRESARQALKMLRDLLKQNIPVKDVCSQISLKMDYSSRLELLHFLFGIIAADNILHESEVRFTEYIAVQIGIRSKDIESIKSMFIKQSDAAYKILEVSITSTDDEIKKAYKKMALRYHPDRVGHLGESFKKEAENKFKKVNEAYELIKKERGIK